MRRLPLPQDCFFGRYASAATGACFPQVPLTRIPLQLQGRRLNPAAGSHVMSDNYIIEVQTGAAGLVVRDGQKYRFFSADRAFDALDGHLFATPRAAEKAAILHARAPRRPRGTVDPAQHRSPPEAEFFSRVGVEGQLANPGRTPHGPQWPRRLDR